MSNNSSNHHTYSTSAYFLSQFASVHQNLHLLSNSNSNNNTNNLTGKATVDSQIRQVKTFMAQRIYNSNGKPTFSFAKKYKSPTASVNDLLSAGKDICMSGATYGIQCVEGFLLSLYNCHRLGVMYTPHLRPNMLAVQWNPLAELLMTNTTESSTEKSFVSALEMTNLVTSTSQAQQACVTALFPLRFVAKDSTRIHSHIVLGVMFLFPEDVNENNNSKQNNTSNNNHPSPPSSSSPSNTRCQTAAMRRNMIQTSGIQAKNANHNDNNNNSENESATSSVSTDNKLPPRFVGTIGISRVSELGTSPHLRRSLGEVCHDFIENYAKWGNEVLEIIVGGPIPLPHLCDKQSGQSRRVNWKLANAVRALFVPDNNNINSKSSPEKSPKQTKNNNNSNSTSNSSNDYDDDGDVDDDDGGAGNKITSPTSGSVVDDDDEVKVLLSSCPGRVVLTETPIFESSLSMMEDIVVRAAFRNQQTLVGTLSPAQLRITGFGNCCGGVNANISKDESSEKSLFGYVAPQPVIRESGNTSNNNSPQKGGCRKNDFKEESPVSSKQKKEIDDTKKKQEIKEKQDGGSILERSASAAVIRARAMELTSSIEKNNNSVHRDREASSKAKTAGDESPSKKKKYVTKDVEKKKIEDDDHEREMEHGSDDNSPLLLQKISKRRPGSSKASSSASSSAKPIATSSSPTTIRNKPSAVPNDNKNKITKPASLPPTTLEEKNIAPVQASPPKLARTASAGLIRPSSRSTSCEVVSPKKKIIKDEKEEEEPQSKPQSTHVNDKTKKTRPASSSFSYHRSPTPDLDSLLKDDATGSPQRKNKLDEGKVVSHNNNLPSIVTITMESGSNSKNRDQRNPNFQNNYNNNNSNNSNGGNQNAGLIINGSARHYEFKMTSSSSSPPSSNATTDRSYNHHISLEEILSAGTSASSNHSKNNNSAPCSASSNNELGASSCSTSSTFSLSPSFGCSLRRNNNDNSVVPVTSSSTFSSASSGRGNNEESRMYSSSSSFSNSSTSMAATLSKVWGQEQIQKSQQQREFKSIQKREEEEREAERRALLLGTVVSSPPRNSQKNNVEDSSQRRLHGRFTSCYPQQQKSEQQYHEESSYCLYDLMNSNNDNNNNHGSQQQQHYNSYPRGSISKGNKNPSSVLDFQYEDL